jgi:hypothetical protein
MKKLLSLILVSLACSTVSLAQIAEVTDYGNILDANGNSLGFLSKNEGNLVGYNYSKVITTARCGNSKCVLIHNSGGDRIGSFLISDNSYVKKVTDYFIITTSGSQFAYYDFGGNFVRIDDKIYEGKTPTHYSDGSPILRAVGE